MPVHDALARAATRVEALVDHRRHLHRSPEVGLELPDTHAYIAGVLTGLGLEPETHPGAGVTARVAGEEAGPPVVLRADMDALPVTERTGLPFASERPGAMHACGHDLHMAMLLEAAALLVQRSPRRDVVLAFQPGEETDRGAVPTLAAHRNLQASDAETFAIHVHATWAPHTVHTRSGIFMAYGDWFRAEFSGPGAHASQPHLAGNPIEAAADVVRRMRAVVDRLRAEQHLVATATDLHSGNTLNVIPAGGTLRGSLRTLSPDIRARLVEGLREAVEEAGRDHRLSATCEVTEGYPGVMNDPGYVERVTAGLAGGPLQVSRMEAPSMVIEDYAYFLQRWPGAMVYLGARVGEATAFNHADDADFDEAVMPTGVALHLLAADGWPTAG